MSKLNRYSGIEYIGEARIVRSPLLPGEDKRGDFKIKAEPQGEKMVEKKDVRLLPLARALESQLTAEQSLTGRHWNSTQKIPHIQRQRKATMRW